MADITGSVDISALEVGGIHSRPISSSVPTEGQIYTWNATTAQWEPQSGPSTNTASIYDDFFFDLSSYTGSPTWIYFGPGSGSAHDNTVYSAGSTYNNPGYLVNTGGGTDPTPLVWMRESLLPRPYAAVNLVPFDATFVVKTPSSFTASASMYIGFAGLQFLEGLENYADSSSVCGFRYDLTASDTHWMSYTADIDASGVYSHVTTASLGNIATSTWYKLRVRFDGTALHFSLNDGTEVTQTTNIPTHYVNYAFTRSWGNNTHAAPAIDLDLFSMTATLTRY